VADLQEGFIGGLANRVKGILSRDKEAQAKRLAKGATSAGALTGYGKDMLQVFGYDSISAYLNIENDLLARYADYEEMDDTPELSQSLNLMADEATQNDYERGVPIWITSPDKTVERMLDEDLSRRRLRLPQEEAWEITRQVLKYGNGFEELLVDETGVVGLNYLPAATVRRIEGPRGELYGFVQDYRGRYGYTPHDFQALIKRRFGSPGADKGRGNKDWERPSRQKAIALEDWEVVHFRLRGKARRSIYGHSILEPARWIWKRLQLLEDAALIYRLQRAPERYAFYVDVGDLPPAEALHYVNRVKQQYKKRRFFDPSTGKLNLRWEPLSQDDDFFIPVRKDQQGARIEVLGAPAWQHMDDIEYFRDKMFAGIGVPKSYLSQEGGVPRQILSNQDVTFARLILRVQREVRNGVSRICRIHLASLGIDPYRVPYDVHMTTPSSIYDLAQIEVMNARADLAARMQAFVSEYFILNRIFKLEDEDIEKIMKQREEDAERLNQQQIRASVTQGQALQQAGLAPPPEAIAAAGVPSSQTQVGKSRQSSEAIDALVKQLADGHTGVSPLNVGAGILRDRYSSGKWEQSIMRGNRQDEKRMEKKLDEVLVNDRALMMRLSRLDGLLQELRYAGRSNGVPE
jgi:hypothetical protein